jgi:hypothetical protein
MLAAVQLDNSQALRQAKSTVIAAQLFAAQMAPELAFRSAPTTPLRWDFVSPF